MGTLLSNMASSLAVAAGVIAVGDLCCRYVGVNADGMLDTAMAEVRRRAAYVGDEAATRMGLDWTHTKARLLALVGAPKECIVCTNEKRPRDFEPAATRCAHAPDVCTDCLRRHCHVEVIEKGRVAELLVCPSPDCTESIDGPDLLRLFDPGDPVIAAHENRLLQHALETDPNFRWCPRNGCGNGQLIDDVDSSTFWVCAKCGSRVCTRHRVVFHEGLTCAAYDVTLSVQNGDVSPKKSTWRSFVGLFSSSSSNTGRIRNNARVARERVDFDYGDGNGSGSGGSTAERKAAAEEKRKAKAAAAAARARAREEAASLAALKRLGIKSCPKCAQGLQKTDGCDHFTCGTRMGCKAQFCWLCMADWGPIIEKGNRYHEKSCRWYA